MKKTSFQIQRYIHDKGWTKITRRIKSTEEQQYVMKCFLDTSKRFGIYAPLYRMRLRNKEWFYFSASPGFNIQNGKLINKEEHPYGNI